MFSILLEYNGIIKYKGESQMENQLNFELVSDEELATIYGGQWMTDGGGSTGGGWAVVERPGLIF